MDVRRSLRALAATAAGVMFITACGGGGTTLETRAPSATSAPTTSTPSGTESSAAPTTAGSATTQPTAAPTTQAPAAPWTPITSNLVGLPSECGNMTSLFVRPDQDELLAGIALQGLWSSVDGGGTWTQLGQDGGSDEIINRPTSMVFDPVDPSRWWESGNYQGAGIYRTDDAGAVFSQLGDVFHSDLVSVDLSDPERQTLLSGTHERAELYRSTDGGASWDNISAALPPNLGYATSPLVIDATTYLLGTNEGPESGVFRTTDGGDTWTTVYSGAISGHPVVSADGTIRWLLRRGGGVIRSTDGGVTWTEQLSNGAIQELSEDLLLLPDGRLATLGGSSVVVSSDDGATWTPVGSPYPPGYAPTGFNYSPFRKSFYIWRFDCSFENDNPIREDSLLSMAFDGG